LPYVDWKVAEEGEGVKKKKTASPSARRKKEDQRASVVTQQKAKARKKGANSALSPSLVHCIVRKGRVGRGSLEKEKRSPQTKRKTNYGPMENNKRVGGPFTGTGKKKQVAVMPAENAIHWKWRQGSPLSPNTKGSLAFDASTRGKKSRNYAPRAKEKSMGRETGASPNEKKKGRTVPNTTNTGKGRGQVRFKGERGRTISYYFGWKKGEKKVDSN